MVDFGEEGGLYLVPVSGELKVNRFLEKGVFTKVCEKSPVFELTPPF